MWPLVRMKGLEPPRLSAPEPKSGASTNSATSAVFRQSHTAIVLSMFGANDVGGYGCPDIAKIVENTGSV